MKASIRLHLVLLKSIIEDVNEHVFDDFTASYSSLENLSTPLCRALRGASGEGYASFPVREFRSVVAGGPPKRSVKCLLA